MNAYELADLIGMCGDGGYNQDAATMLRQQQNEIEDLINAHRFVQNFAEEQHQRAVALESELDRAVELYTDKAIENEALEQQLKKEIQARADALDDLNNRMMKFMKSYNEMAWKLEEVGGAYTHPVKELTDEEIRHIQAQCHLKNVGYDNFIMRFARAILRKAQEK